MDFTSYSNASYFVLDWGNHSDGFVTANANYYGGAAVLTANGHRLDSFNAAGNGRVTIAQVDTYNNLLIGSTGNGSNSAANVIINSPLLPRIDNAILLGAPQNRWSSVWSATPTIQTSARAHKTEIAPVGADLAAAFVDRIAPVSFRYITGGMDPVERTVERSVHATEVIGGIETLAYDEEPELDEKGQPIMLSALHEVRDENGVPKMRSVMRRVQVEEEGRLIEREELHEEPVLEKRQFPKTKRVPRMEMKPVVEVDYVAREGRRLHYGFVADEFKAVMDDLGVDFGGYVKDAATGEEGLRYGEIIALLWADLKTTKDRLAALETGARA